MASLDIEQTIKEIQSAVAAGVMGMDKFSDQVRRGMQAQATGAEQISEALTQLTEASQQTVQSLRQSTDAIGGLNEVARDLRGAVSRFKLA